MEHALIEKKLKDFISLISSNRIKLVSLESNINENFSGILDGSNIKRNVEFNLKSMGTGEQNEKDLIVFGEYEIEIQDQMEDILLISLKAHYKLVLKIQQNDEYNKDLTKEQQEIIGIFFNQSGRLILFPYVRHLYDIISREGDFLLPSIPPIVFKK